MVIYAYVDKKSKELVEIEDNDELEYRDWFVLEDESV